jgi:acylaminoacyl-peptidase
VKAAILLCILAFGAGAQRRPWSPADLSPWRTAEDVRIRPDGKWVVWTERVAGRSNLWVGSTDGREHRQWVEGGWSPRWSPDGERIAWISDRGVRVRKFDGGAETEVAGAYTPQAIAWSAEGDRIAVTGRTESKPEAPAWAPPSIVPHLRGGEAPSRIFVAGKQISTANCDGEASWSLDGKSVIAVCDGVVVAITVADGSVKRLTKDPGRYESPVVSPDGGRIAYLFTEPKAQTYVIRKLWVMNADGSRARVLSGSLDRDATAPQWSSESRTVYFIADDRGSTHVYAARNDGTVRQVTNKPERLAGFSLADNGRAASVRSSATEGGNVVTFTVDVATQPVTVAEPNGKLLAEREIGAVQPIEWDSDGNRVQGWLTLPPGFDPAGKYPLLVDVQDDPRRMCGGEFSPRAQALAARGIVVLCGNPRGTPGYGEQFGALLKTRNPGDDLDDLVRGVEAVIAKGYVDAQRVTLEGGLVAAWALGHSTRFAKVVARRPVVIRGERSPLVAAESFRTPTLILAPEGDAQAEALWSALGMNHVAREWVRATDVVTELEAVAAWISGPGK